MSPKIHVSPLSYLCIKFVSRILIQVLSDDECSCYEVVEKYLTDTTYQVLQDLLKNILNSLNLDASTKFSCLQVLLRVDIRKLDTGIFPHSYYQKILEVITWKGKGLQQLNLKGVWVRDHPVLLNKLLSSLNNLQVLIIPHMADDTLLASLSFCKYLRVLDISGEVCFTQNGLSQLRSQTIQVLYIGSFGKKEVCDNVDIINNYELLREVILNLPNLKSLRTYSFSGSVLLLLYRSNPDLKTKLTYLHDTGTTNDTLDAIINLCPALESIHIDSPEIGVILKLRLLNKLNCLKLTKPTSDELVNYLRTSGSKIEVLKVNHNKNTALDLSEICLSAPSLQTLECYQMKLDFTQLDTYFMSLQNIEILYCDISDNSVLLLFSNCPFLKRILVGCEINLTDGDMFRLCAECDFALLEEIWLSCARGLTIISIDLLMRHCPNLKVIGQTTGWDITNDEIQYMTFLIQVTNTDLTLLPLLSDS